MATIKVQRNSEFNNKMRYYKVFIDGEQVGTIADGQTIEFQTTAGHHTVIAKIDWCSSQEISFTVQDNDTKELQVSGFKGGNTFLISMLVLPYYLTIGRKRYLSLEELN